MEHVQAVIDPGKKVAKLILGRNFNSASQKMYKTWSKRISKNCICHSNWFCHYGIYWFFCKAYTHSYQQYYRRRWLIWIWKKTKYEFIYWFFFFYSQWLTCDISPFFVYFKNCLDFKVNLIVKFQKIFWK